MGSNLLRSLADLDGGADQRAVLGPRAVVVLHVRIAEELDQREPRVGRTLADAAVRDDLGVAADPGSLVERTQLVGRLEGTVVVGGLGPRDVCRAGDVARNLGLLLGEVVRRELLAAVLLGRADVDERTVARLLEDLVAKGADGVVALP